MAESWQLGRCSARRGKRVLDGQGRSPRRGEAWRPDDGWSRPPVGAVGQPQRDRRLCAAAFRPAGTGSTPAGTARRVSTRARPHPATRSDRTRAGRRAPLGRCSDRPLEVCEEPLGIRQVTVHPGAEALAAGVLATALRAHAEAPAGVATELVHGLTIMGLARIQVVISVANRQSLRVARRLELTPEGIRHSALRIGDQRHDACAYVALADDVTRGRRAPV